MSRFLEDIAPFLGTGQKNANGETLEQFLEKYDPTRYETPSCTTDAVIFSYEREEDLTELFPGWKILLVKRSNHPSIGYWALPGGFANMREDLDVTAKRELEEETGASGVLMEQFATYGKMDRDPRTRVITTAYMALVERSKIQVQAGDDAADAAWFSVGLRLLGEEKEGGKTTRRYELTASCPEKDVTLRAIVRQHETIGLIRQQNFTVLDGGELAVDHAAIIVHALTILRGRMKSGDTTGKHNKI